MLSYVLPTRNRPATLARTLAAIGSLPRESHERMGGAEVVVVDNASSPPTSAPFALRNDVPVRVLHRARNEAASGRNAGVEAARGDWIVMLDDDSAPSDGRFAGALLDAPEDVTAIGAEIFLADGRRESGGLPEVFIGCGAAIRREAFLEAGGYDPAFHYYAEEYDLAARLIRMGGRISFDRRFRVVHEKTTSGRDMDVILRRLVRNNAWVTQRYAPRAERMERLRETLTRYARIARRERALRGYLVGLGELASSAARQPRREMTHEEWDRFTGLRAARSWLGSHASTTRARRIAIVDRGKHDWCVERALLERGVRIVGEGEDPETLVIGTLSPGPMLDSFERRAARGEPVVMAWDAGTGGTAREEGCARHGAPVAGECGSTRAA